jgi:Na+-translocating ferredoxin:NAD+ oxidoreductase RnfE subunit
MSGWLRHFALSAQVRTGYSSEVVVWAAIAVVAATVALVFLLIAAFVWLAARYDSLTAGLVLGGIFVVIALVAVIACLVTRRRNIERARLELAARNSASANWLDPKLLGVGFQIGQAIGWRKLAALAAVGLVTAGLAKEWFGRDATPPDGDELPPEG